MEETSLNSNERDNVVSGPLSLLTECVKDGSQVLVSCRNNRKLLGRVRAYDRHCNLVMETVTEIWPETNKKGKASINRDRFIPKMFVRGDSVVLILRNPVQ